MPVLVVLLAASISAISPSVAMARPQTQDYRIGARDQIEVRVFGVEELDVTVRVSETGSIELPLIGGVEAAGLSRDDLATAIAERLKAYIREPEVFVNILEYQSQRFSLVGAVSSPGTYSMNGRTTLFEALLMGGGVTLDDAAGPISIIRPRLANVPFTIDAREFIERGNMAFNVTVEAGDIINVVPKRIYKVHVFGRVNTPGTQELKDPITLMSAISLAGGLSERAAANRVIILRRSENGTQTPIKVNLKDIEEGKAADVELQPDDVVLVPETWF